MTQRFNNRLLAAAGVSSDLIVDDPFPNDKPTKCRPFSSLVDTWQGPREKAKPVNPNPETTSPEQVNGE